MWDELNSYIDDDERLVWPEVYLENPKLYESVRDVVYLVRGNHPEDRLDWVSEMALPNVLKNDDVKILGKQLIVRLRLPWHQVRREWLITQKELDANRDIYDIIDVYLKVRRKDGYPQFPFFDKLAFEANRNDYEFLEARYLVTWKMSKLQEARLLGIDPDNVHTYMSE
jgi:hypothetical protein